MYIGNRQGAVTDKALQTITLALVFDGTKPRTYLGKNIRFPDYFISSFVIAIEEVLLNSLDTEEQVAAVTSIPDEKKGEELAVLYLEKASTADKLFEIADRA